MIEPEIVISCLENAAIYYIQEFKDFTLDQ